MNKLGKERPPFPVKLFVGILYGDRRAFDEIRDSLVSSLGEIDLESEEIPFKWTNYYEEELGSDLKRVFVSFVPLISPEQIVDIKRFTNRLEGEQRKINLDPGYIEGGKLVLATTKDQAHRIYIGKGIYAEVTLRFKDGRYIPFDYTYPDYRSEEYHEFFLKIRKKYFEDLRSSFPPTSKLTTLWALKGVLGELQKTKGVLVIKRKRDIIEIMELVQKARKNVDVLILAVLGDREEAEALSHVDLIDYVFSFKGKVQEIASLLKPDFLFVSGEFGFEALEFYEGRVLRL
ncbi:MAG: hypothetical protein PWQ16_1042 [bacterium]|nr:hypothetical protein [bacterium]